jgi:alpha 1,3-glucosidase
MFEFPNDEKTFAMDDQYMLGSSLVIKPVVAAGQISVDIYLGKESVI